MRVARLPGRAPRSMKMLDEMHPRRGVFPPAGMRCNDVGAAPYWIVSLRAVVAGFLTSVSSSTPLSNFAELVVSSSSSGSVKLR